MDEGYCDYCEQEGHTFSSCPKRDDSVDLEAELEWTLHTDPKFDGVTYEEGPAC